MQRWGFSGQPASHGCSLTHRAIGSTGQCQDPGKVFKGKKMPGRGGFKVRQNVNLKVYRIDYERSLIYVTGSVPGANGSLIKIRDALYCDKIENDEILNYPTFVYQKGVEYANVIDMEPPKEDSGEQWLHENAIVKDKNDDGGGDD